MSGYGMSATAFFGIKVKATLLITISVLGACAIASQVRALIQQRGIGRLHL
jgi:hypothetical protein